MKAKIGKRQINASIHGVLCTGALGQSTIRYLEPGRSALPGRVNGAATWARKCKDIDAIPGQTPEINKLA